MAVKDDLADDLLDGAASIANYTGYSERRVRYAEEKGLLPIFRIGSRLTARKSELSQHLAAARKAACDD
jgi:hypothetical protein